MYKEYQANMAVIVAEEDVIKCNKSMYQTNRLRDIGFKSLAGVGVPAPLIIELYFGKVVHA